MHELVKLAEGDDEERQPEPPADPLRFQEAVRAFRARVPMSDADFYEMLEASHARAFVVAGVAKLDLVTQVWKALDDAISNGTTFEDFKKTVGAQLEEEWGRKNPARLETIFRTNTQRSYSAGKIEMMRNPAISKRRPYWRYTAILDGRTTVVCKTCDGTTLPADHPFWATHQPPLHFNCRATIRALTVSQAETMGVSDEPPTAEPLDGFGNVERDQWKPDLSKYPPELAHEFVVKTAR